MFNKDFQAGHIIPLGETPSGKSEMSQGEIFEHTYSLMSRESEHHPLNDAVSLVINEMTKTKLTTFETILHKTVKNPNVVGVVINTEIDGK